MLTTKQNKWEIDGLLAMRCLVESEVRVPRKRRARYDVDRQRIPKLIAELARTKTKRIRQPNIIARLEEAANRGSETDFLKTLAEVKWQDRPASEFVLSIKLAFRAGAFGAARHIVTEAAKHHSEDDELKKYVRLLMPERKTIEATKAPVNTQANRAWLEKHAGEYRGKWVALRNGELLGVAESLNSLVQEVSERYSVTFPSKEIMVTTGY